MKDRKGSTLLTTLAVTALLAVLGFVVSEASLFHLHVSNTEVARQNALNLARSAVSLSIAKLSEDPDFGKAGGPTARQLLEVPEHGPNERGVVLFDAQQASQMQLPCSTNNFSGSAAITDELGNVVPKGSIRLIGLGQSGGVTRRVQAVVTIPPFPFAVASSGPVVASGGVEICGLKELPADGNLEAAPRTEGDLVSNDANLKSVFLGANTKISGSVQTSGTVAKDPTAPMGSIEVRGAIRDHADHERIPTIHLLDYDPANPAKASPHSIIESSVLSAGSNRISGRLRHQGALEVRDGLFLDGCQIFVDGDLKITGGIHGKGLVVVTGKTELTGQSRLEGSDSVALLSGGDTVISGSGAQGSFFKGLVYTNGRFLVDKVTLVGSLISDDERGHSAVTLKESRIFRTDDVVTFTTTPGTSNSGTGGSAQDGSAPVIDCDVYCSAVASDPRANQGNVQRDLLPFSIQIRLVGGRLVAQTSLSGLSYGAPFAISSSPSTALQQILAVARVQTRDPRATLGGGSRLQAEIASAIGTLTGGSAGTSTPGGSVVTVDPSSFLKLQERMRVVIWREDS